MVQLMWIYWGHTRSVSGHSIKPRGTSMVVRAMSAPETAGPSAAVKPAGTCMPNGEKDRARGGMSEKEEKEVPKSFLCSV